VNEGASESARQPLGAPNAPLTLRARRRAAKLAENGLLSRAAITIFHWSTTHDSLHSVLGGAFWDLDLWADAYCDSDDWCWGDRSRYGYDTGPPRCDFTGKGFSFDRYECRYVNDPSKSSLYASYEGQACAPWPLTLCDTKKIHRHWNHANTWVWFG